MGLVALSDMVVEERPMSAAELERFFDDDEIPFVDCEEVGGATWDWGPIDESSPRDRQPTDALADALDRLNDDLQDGDLGWLPPTGWLALVRRESSFVFVLPDDADRWIAYVIVTGDPDLGVWRQQRMVGCDPRFL